MRNVNFKWGTESRSSELSLVFVSKNAVINVSSKLEKENGEWHAKKLELKDKNTGFNTIYIKLDD